MKTRSHKVLASAFGAALFLGTAGGAHALSIDTSLAEGAGAGPNALQVGPAEDFVDIDIDTGDSASYLFNFIAPSGDYPLGGEGQAEVAITTEFSSDIGPSDLTVGWSNGESETFTDGSGLEIGGADFVLTNSFSAGDEFDLTVSFSGYTGDATAGVDLDQINGTPSAVPVPAALPLLIGGLGILGAAGWRRKKS